MTNEKVLSLLAEEHLAAIGAKLCGGHIPRGEITFGIALTAVKYGVVTTKLGDHLGIALGAVHAGLTNASLGELTLGIATASIGLILSLLSFG